MSTQSVLFDLPGPKARARNTIFNVLAAIALVGLIVYAVWMLAKAGQLDTRLWQPMIEWRSWKHYFLSGLYYTILAAVISVVLALVLVIVSLIVRLSELVAIRWVCGAVVDFFLTVPDLVVLIVVQCI